MLPIASGGAGNLNTIPGELRLAVPIHQSLLQSFLALGLFHYLDPTSPRYGTRYYLRLQISEQLRPRQGNLYTTAQMLSVYLTDAGTHVLIHGVVDDETESNLSRCIWSSFYRPMRSVFGRGI